MVAVSVGRDRLFEALGSTFTPEAFEVLCYKFGIELDDVASEDGEVIYKFEVPPTRYDLLCLEGLSQALRIFNRVDPIPTYTVANISTESMLKMHVKPETSQILPYVVCAVLRGVTFNEARFNSFIELQDRLNQNRRKALVAIGTHDLDTIKGPFTYEALPPKDINSILKQTEKFSADVLMEHYKKDLKLKNLLNIIEDSPVYPVIYDGNRTLLALPPFINGAHSAITLKTKNVFIECTTTDLAKANIFLNTMVTMFSMYCKRKFEVEPVEVTYATGLTYVSPDLSLYQIPASHKLRQAEAKIAKLESEMSAKTRLMKKIHAALGDAYEDLKRMQPDDHSSCDLDQLMPVLVNSGIRSEPSSPPFWTPFSTRGFFCFDSQLY